MKQIDPKTLYRQSVDIAALGEGPADFEAVPETPRADTSLSQQARDVAALFSDRPISRRLLAGSVRTADFVALVGLGLTILTLAGAFDAPRIDRLEAVTVPIGAALAVLFVQAVDGYQISSFRDYAMQLGRVIAAWAMLFAGGAALAFFTGRVDAAEGAMVVRWFLGGIGWFVLSRFVITHLVRNWTRDGRLERRAVIVGGGKLAEELIRGLEAQPGNDIRICGIFDDRDDERSPAMVEGYPKLGTVPELVEFGRIIKLDMLIVALPVSAAVRVQQLLRKLWVLPVDIRLSAHADKLKFRPRNYSYEGSLPFIDVVDKPLADWDAVTKRIFDLVVGSIALLVLSPIMIGAAIAVKATSKGPIFFRQKRFGFNNEVVSVWKFRSMYVDKCDHDVKQAVTKGDPRVTPVGRFIRKTSIDELPQLFNVLMGELSLVGPRPHAVNAQTENHLWDTVVDGYFARHKVKPGVTGWAQINGWRGEIDTPEKIRKRVEHDIYYIENWSILFDLKILALTPFRLFDTRNAY
ncbi:undecaprenyl-phosphate glucose phosphotransferase [Pinisolibacter aquiterrae]|uniref:undecaprenyl-phosphate glucose phosphotransferase n=1 Tax=Pinisolibacter aquiterrae TaxID=2815579 RepID=UPI001C3E4E15|nr:undecaprenyl-phosphate glucose phosphotransferase [Pinisolibacter aquiterrae]MBV5264115.1 undecaprenyl-phosphate glucose phosphotransferase [Pinisolibacter aquiterrae]MCC8233790.1 undecaprenyl-phosphate glucose phosphotransferase [Pinisolibacter aquiterrae]